jgi:hypothetical protein
VADIFHEVEEDLRRDRYAKLWKAYGRYVIVLAVLAVAGTGAFTGWREYRDRQREAQGQRYEAALKLVQANQPEAALTALADFSREAGPGYAALARLQQAGLLARQGRFADAISIYDQVAGNSDAIATLRQLAVFLAARYTLEMDNPVELDSRLARASAADNPWRHSAQELRAVAALRAGDRAKASEHYKALSDDTAAPASLRARAAEMIQALRD